MRHKQEILINKSKLFEKVNIKEKNKCQLALPKRIVKDRKEIKELVTDTFGKIRLNRKPSPLQLLEKGMKELFFGKKGIVTQKIPKLEQELIKKEIHQSNKLDDKIYLGSLDYLTQRDKKKDYSVFHNNELIRRRLMKSSHYSLLPQKINFNKTFINKAQNTSRANTSFMNKTLNSQANSLSMFQTGIIINKPLTERNTTTHNGKKMYKVINSNNYNKARSKLKKPLIDITQSSDNSTIHFKTSTCNSPVRNLKQTPLLLNMLSLNNNNTEESTEPNSFFKPFIKASLLTDYNKIVPNDNNHTTNNTPHLFTPMNNPLYDSPKTKRKLNSKYFTQMSNSLQMKIKDFSLNNEQIGYNLAAFVEATNREITESNEKNKDPMKVEKDYEVLFNKRMTKKKRTVITKEKLNKTFKESFKINDPIQAQMNHLVKNITKLSSRQAESYAANIASKYLKKNDHNLLDEDDNHPENTFNPESLKESKSVKEMKKRMASTTQRIYRMRQDIIQRRIKLMEQFPIECHKKKSVFGTMI